MTIQPTSFPPHPYELIEPMATPQQQSILKPLYEAEAEADRQGLGDVQEQLSGLIWHLNKEWGFLND